jgi:hypothetical protein
MARKKDIKRPKETKRIPANKDQKVKLKVTVSFLYEVFAKDYDSDDPEVIAETDLTSFRESFGTLLYEIENCTRDLDTDEYCENIKVEVVKHKKKKVIGTPRERYYAGMAEGLRAMSPSSMKTAQLELIESLAAPNKGKRG